MIFLQVENYCQNCPEFEPRCLRLAKLGEHDTFIECEHEDRCRTMKKYIEQQQISGKEEQ